MMQIGVRLSRCLNSKIAFARDPGVGVFWFALGSTALAEIAGKKQPDAIVIDMQHGLWDRMSLEWVVGLAPRPVLVRVSENSPVAIGQALDTGAEGVLVAMVETSDEAERAVASAHYPPKGNGADLSRSDIWVCG